MEAFGRGRTEALATHAYVIVETLAVARRRYGPSVAADIIDRVIPALDVTAVDAALHASAVAAFRDTVESSSRRLTGPASPSCAARASSARSPSTPTSEPRGSRRYRSLAAAGRIGRPGTGAVRFVRPAHKPGSGCTLDARSGPPAAPRGPPGGHVPSSGGTSGLQLADGSDGGTLLEQVPEGRVRIAAEEPVERALGQVAALGRQPLVVLLGEQ